MGVTEQTAHPDAVLEEIQRRSKGGMGEIRPDYDGLGLASVPATILEMFGVRQERGPQPNSMIGSPDIASRSRKVILLVADGLGYSMFTRHSRSGGILGSLARARRVIPITSVFPSTTAAAVTTLNSGLTPQEHGLPEWVVYMRELDRTITSLPFSPLGSKVPDTLAREGADPRMLYEGPTIYEQLSPAGVRCYDATDASLAFSAYSSRIYRMSTTLPFRNNAQMIQRLKGIMEDRNGPAYCYAYYGDIDTMSHRHGPSSDESAASVERFSSLFQELANSLTIQAAEDSVLIMVADHGQVAVAPEETEYLSDLRELTKLYELGPSGRPIPPTGSPRDVFLHVKAGSMDKAESMVERHLGGSARITRTKDALEDGYFGTGSTHPEFQSRVGNLLVLPEGRRTVWYEHMPGERFDLRGMHGGLSMEEMLIPLGIARFSDLR